MTYAAMISQLAECRCVHLAGCTVLYHWKGKLISGQGGCTRVHTVSVSTEDLAFMVDSPTGTISPHDTAAQAVHAHRFAGQEGAEAP